VRTTPITISVTSAAATPIVIARSAPRTDRAESGVGDDLRDARLWADRFQELVACITTGPAERHLAGVNRMDFSSSDGQLYVAQRIGSSSQKHVQQPQVVMQVQKPP
jgi:hypothetical protein